ncbi:MAG TPA: FAD-dependent oxidoreductase [Steroidobacteraceae bacterium]|nr:FAD-dependent oxidoreductase [Steroidobacteraceae bacterium]
MTNSSATVDVVVVGSGNGALASALCLYELGVRDVVVIEKAAKYGGTSATSGGGVWVPCNRYARAAGAQDSLEDAREYLRATIPAGAVPQELIDTYLREAPKMIDFLHERTRVRYRTLAHYPDYYSAAPGSRPGHRSMEPEPVMRSVLGAEGGRLVDTHHMMWLMDRVAFTQEEAAVLVGQSAGWKKLAAKLFWHYYTDIPWVFTHHRSRRLACGAAGIARLRWSMLERQMPLWLDTALTDLRVDASGRVAGVLARRGSDLLEIEARKGVVLAAGGFEQNQAMREQYLPKPTNTAWSGGAPTNTGDALRAALELGAATRLMNGAWWCQTIKAPDDPVPRMAIMEKSYPGCCVVNRRGRRIANESQNYMAYQLAFFAKHSEADPQTPSWLVFDARFRRRYFVGPLLNSRFRPDRSLPRSYFETGFLTKADSIEELARLTGIEPAGLGATICAMNEYARSGKDLEFGRGDSTYDRYYGDPTVTPNPCLAPIAEPPYYAMRVDPGDFATHGGLCINPDAQVLNLRGDPIAGLYAIGNTAAAILPTYPGPGATLGPAMTFGWQAAKHIAGRS